MKIDDIFESMTDIDDKFIEAAKPLELCDVSPMTAKPAPRRAAWKTLVPAAACAAAVLTTAGVVGVKYLRGRGVETSSPEISSPAVSSSGASFALDYPEEAKYIVDEEITRLNLAYPAGKGGPSWYDDNVNYAKGYDELAEQSDLIVSGTFIGDIHQTQDINDMCVADGEVDSYNKLEIDRVIKGDVSAGDFLIIHQASIISSCNETGNLRMVYCEDQLSPMFKGDKWIYFLKLEENGTFSPVNGPQGRYPLPSYTNRFAGLDVENTNVDEFSTYKNAAPARDEIYEELLKKLAEIEIKAPELEFIKIPEESFTTFAIEEFPDVEFNVSRLGVTANDVDVFAMNEGETLETLILTDLNNDGKRELCATISGVTKSVAVCNYENGAYYTLSGKRDYFLSVENNVLILNDRCWYSSDLVASVKSELSLEQLTMTVPNDGSWFVRLDNGQKVTPEEFPEFTFTANSDGILVSETDFGYVSRVIFGGFDLCELSLEDTNDDGKRELVATTDVDTTLVYDIATGETFRKTSTDSLTKADVMDYSRVSWENRGAFTLPDMDGFRFVLGENEYRKSLSISYDCRYGGGIGLNTGADAVYFCDLDGDGQRELIISGDGDGVWVYGIMDDGDLGRARYHEEDYGRVIEMYGRILLQTNRVIKDINYSKSDLKSLRVDPLNPWDDCFNLGDSSDYGYYDIALDIEYRSTTFNNFFPNDDNYSFTIKNGTLQISREHETLLKTGKLKELYGVTDAENDCLLFVYSNEDGSFDAFMLSENSSKLVHIDDIVDINVVLTNHRDISIDFKDGRGVSLIDILTLMEDY